MDEDKLITKAQETPLTRDAIEAFAARMPETPAGELIQFALSRYDAHSATVFALAAVARGQELPSEALFALLPDLVNPSHFAPLVAAVEGDRIAFLNELVVKGRMDWEREALSLFLAVELLDGSEPPQNLRRTLRVFARLPIDENSGFIFGCALQHLEDDEIREVGRSWIRVAEGGDSESARNELRAPLFKPVLETLPSVEKPAIVTGYTLRKLEPKAGRNDPCPCKSGRKYKKCCGAADAEPRRSGATASGVRLQDLTREGVEALDEDQLRLLLPLELASLKLEWLNFDQLQYAAIELTLRRRLSEAERFVDELTKRGDDAMQWARDSRNELIRSALLDGDVSLAERQIVHCSEEDDEFDSFQLRITLQRGDAGSLEFLLATVEDALRADDWMILFDLSFALLDHAPALGILVARGCLDPDRPYDSDLLLDKIADARSRLDLDMREPWDEVYELWALDYLESEGDELIRNAKDQDRDQISENLNFLHNEMADALDQSRTLQRQLRTAEAELARVAMIIAGVNSAMAEPTPEEHDKAETDVWRLRTLVTELKVKVADSVLVRREVRRYLVSVQEERERSVPAEERDAALAEASAGEIEGSPVDAPRDLLLPRFDDAEKSLKMLPRTTAAQAMTVAAKLASGDSHSWNGVMKVRAGQDVLVARVRVHYRMLFRVSDGVLDCLMVVHRRVLNAALDEVSS